MRLYKKQVIGYLNRLSKKESRQYEIKDKKIIENGIEIKKLEKNFCPNCGNKTTEDFNFCDHCGNKLTETEQIIKKDSTIDNKLNNKSPILTLLLSLLIPGLGHIYIHKFKKGISYFIIIIGLFILPNIILFNDIDYTIMIAANSIFIIDFIIYIYSLIDVYKTTKKMKLT